MVLHFVFSSQSLAGRTSRGHPSELIVVVVVVVSNFSLSCIARLHSRTNSWCPLLSVLCFSLPASKPGRRFPMKRCLLVHPSGRLKSLQQARSLQHARSLRIAMVQSSSSIQKQVSVIVMKLDTIGGTLASVLFAAGLSFGMSDPNSSKTNSPWYLPVSLAGASGFCTSSPVSRLCACCRMRRPSETCLEQSWEFPCNSKR